MSILAIITLAIGAAALPVTPMQDTHETSLIASSPDEVVIEDITLINEPVNTAGKAVSDDSKVVDPVCEDVDEFAVFPGGTSSMMKWIGRNMRYPSVAVENGIQGKVVVRFIVCKDGSTANPVIMKGVDRDLDKEAVRLVKRMPKWTPAKKDGVPVNSYFTLPVIFSLQGD